MLLVLSKACSLPFLHRRYFSRVQLACKAHGMRMASTVADGVPRVGILHKEGSPFAEIMRNESPEVADFVGIRSVEDLLKVGKPLDALVLATPYGIDNFMDQAWESLKGSLKWVHNINAGVDNMQGLMKKLRQEGDIPLTNGSGAFSKSLAEYVLSSTLHFNKQVPRLLKNCKEKKWDRFTMNTIEGKQIGFVGFGDIALQSARLTHACGMKCAVYRRVPSKTDPKIVSELNLLMYDNVDDLLRESDVVVCTMPGTPATKHFFDQRRLALLKDNTIFINCGRGSCVDEEAIYKEVSNRRIFAALDVFEVEPLPESSPLWNLPAENFLLTAHNADLTDDVFNLGWSVFRKNLEKFKKGETFCTLVDKQAGY